MELFFFIIVICISYLYANLFFIDSVGINQHLMQTCSKIKATTLDVSSTIRPPPRAPPDTWTLALTNT